MKLSRILYIIISVMFFVIFTGNLYITIDNTKSYLESETETKLQDTSVSLGLRIKSLIGDKKDPEIELIISAIADSGFYKEIRLEEPYYTITTKDIISANSNLNDLDWNIEDVSIDKKYGEIVLNNQDDISNELNLLEGVKVDENSKVNSYDKTFTFIPTDNFKDNSILEIKYTAAMNNKLLEEKSKIKLTKILVLKKRDVKFDNVPSWFINFIDIKIDEKSTQISDQWKTSAILFISANPGIAYEKLYIQLKDTLAYSIIAFILSVISLYYFLKLILNPLNKIEKLANDISNGTFSQIVDIPKAKELKIVTLAMNNMSFKIKDIINKLNKNVEEKSEKLNLDELTKLQKEQSFLSDIKNMFIEKKDGFVCYIRIENLEEYSKQNTSDDVNKYIINFSTILKEENSINTYRIFGSHFAFITHNNSIDDIKNISNCLKIKFENLSKIIDVKNIMHMGITKFNKYSTVDDIINSSKEAYNMAKLIGYNEVFIQEKNEQARDPLEWKEFVFKVIKNSKFSLDYIGDIKCLKTNSILLKEAFSKITDNNKDVPIGTFVSIAQEYNKIVEFDKKVIEKVIKFIKNKDIKYEIAINLSIESIKDTPFKTTLVNILKENSNISNQLVFTLTAYNIQQAKDDFINFTKIVQKFGAYIMIKRYEAKFIPIDEINLFKPNYIRLARDYTDNISSDSNKKELVDSVCKIATLLDIKVYSENVKNDDDLNTISSLDITGTSR